MINDGWMNVCSMEWMTLHYIVVLQVRQHRLDTVS
jgi:hypothetical protein